MLYIERIHEFINKNKLGIKIEPTNSDLSLQEEKIQMIFKIWLCGVLLALFRKTK